MSKYDDYGYRIPKLDPDAKERRERPQRKKKDTRKWCKGVVGREHKPEIVFDTRFRSPCGWAPKWAWQLPGKKWWMCHHIEKCTVCGKHMRQLWEVKADECPDYQKLVKG
jgi:hypothetical protein